MALGLSPAEIIQKSVYPLLNIHPNWRRIPLSEVADVLNGFAFNSANFNTRSVGKPLIRIRDIGKSNIETFYDGSWSEQYLVQNGDMLVGMDGDFKCARWHGIEALLNQRVCKIIPRLNYSSKFLYYVLQPYLDAINAETSSVTVKHLSSKTIQQIPLPNPPIAIQKAIVVKIEELFSELDAGVQELQIALARLKTYRQAVLHHYLNNPEWDRVKLSVIVNKVFDGPFGSNLKSADYIDQPGYQVIRLENVGQMEFISDKETFISEEKFALLEKHEIFEGDIIFSSFVGDNIRTTIIPKLKYRAINKADCFCIRTDQNRINRKFLVYLLSTERVHKAVTLDVHGATRPRINTSQLKSLVLSVPDILVQNQIVSEVESRLSEADVMETAIRQELIRAENLRQSILKQAFEGRLVTTAFEETDTEKLAEVVETNNPVYGGSGEQLSLF